MTEPVMDFSDVPEQPEQPARRRGRPRSQETVERDERVLTALRNGPQTKEKLVEELELAPNMVYLSLWRLKRENRVERTSDGSERHIWKVTE